MNDKIRFMPVRGTDAAIQQLAYNDGKVYFTTDTGKIYMDKDGQRILMGNSGVSLFYGYDPAPFHNEEDIEPIYTLVLSLISDYDQCKADDLILNQDGCFYRIDSINKSADQVVCTRLAVSGSGEGGGTVVHQRDVFIDWDSDTIQTGSIFVANQTYYAICTPRTEAEGDIYCTVIFDIIDNANGTSTKIVKNQLPSGQPYKFDVSQLPVSSNITLKVTVTSDNSQYNEGLGYTKTLTNIKVVEMALVKPTIDTYLPLVKPDDLSGTLTLRYLPVGDNSISLKLHVYIDDIEDVSLQADVPSSYYNRVVTSTIPRQTHGVHTIEFKLSTVINGETVYSNGITYEGAWASADDDTPIIWVGEYDPVVVNYENSYIYYMVYDPISYRNGLPAEVHLQKDGRDISQIDASYSDDGWLVWDISNVYSVGPNDFSINCRTVKTSLLINVTTEGSRDLGLTSESSLLLNINTAGRSSSEIKSQRTILQSTVNTETTTINLNNFNWQNNGWKDSEGVDSNGVDSGSFLSIANGSSLDIKMGGNGLVLNSAKDYSFECRFRIRNVQEYSTLIRTIPKFFYSIYNEETGEYVPTYNIDSNGTVTGPSLYEEEIEALGYKIGLDEYGNLLMDENNTVKKEDTSSGVVVKWLNDAGYGFCIGTQEAYFKTPSGIANVRYCEDEVINIAFVASKSDNLCYIYLNGILSGAIAMPVGAGSSFTINSAFEFNSEYCDFDLYRFRVYELGLTMPQVIHNYLSDMHSIVLYDQNQITDPLDDYALSYDLLVDYNRNNPTAPTMPYMTWQITDGTDEVLPYVKGGARVCAVEFVNAPLDAAFAAGEIDEWYYYTHSPSFKASGTGIDVQGTSSQKYPRRNYKLKYKSAKKNWVYTQGSLKDKPLTEKYTVLDKDGVSHTLSKKFHMDNEDVGVNKFTMKIDYMESSGTYNTGFANLLGNLSHPIFTKHPLSDLNLGLDTDKLRTSVYGYPVLTFHKYADGSYEYIGKYNMNLDKGANEAYGFEDETEHPYVPQRVRKVLNSETNEYEDETYQPTIAEIAECWELKDNQGTWCSFKYPDAESRELGFMTLQENTSGDSAKLEVLNHYEYRYSYYEDQLDAAYEYTTFKDPDTQVEYANNGQINAYLYEKHKNLETLFNWLDSTDVNNATNNVLDSPVVYNVSSTVDNDDSISYVPASAGVWTATFTKDTKEYRRQKFRTEFSQHLDKEYCLTYFVLTELLLCYDSRGKNMMLATFGPHKMGGEYIWYPIFYDIDTQLGLNNSGAYLWDYDADVTKDNLFSTPTSILWTNLYDLFYDEIVQKYRVLRGISNPSGTDAAINQALTYQNIVGAYECDPNVFDSYAMKGVRPIVAIGLDEYYKYLAPALRPSDYALGKKYAGYYDTSGAHLYQDTPTYMYACQGDKKLTTELLLRNRLNYIDSWWLGGDYRAGVVENQIFIRANANHSSTSDLFLDSNLLSEIPSTAAGKGFSLESYPKAYFDARPGAKIKPFLHQYVSYFMDNQPSVPVKYDGSSGQEDGVWTNVDAAKLIAFKTEPDLSQQITYIPGGDYISSLGDLSLMYANSLQIFHGRRLLDFKLGSDIPGYKNPLITSASDWELTAMPLLRSVNLCKLSQFNRELNLTASAKLQEFRALDSIIERINFASGAPLHTVHLPETITTVSLVQNQDLKNILTTKPTIVEPNDSGSYDYVDPNSYKGLYIEGVTDYTVDKAGTGHKLVTYEVVGGGLGYNSYIILNNLYSLKHGATSNQYLRASLTDVQWTPYEQIEYGTLYNSEETYYLLNDHSTFEDFTFTTTEDWENKLLNGVIYTYNSAVDETIVTDLSLLDAFIDAYEIAKAAGTESQFANTSGSSSATLPTLTGTLYVSNDSSNGISESLLTSKYKTYFPNLDIQIKNVIESKLTKYVRVYESGKLEVLDTERTDDTTPLLPTITAPTQTNYDFLGWSLDNPNEVDNPELALIYDSSTMTYTTTSIWDNLQFTDENNVFTLYAIFTIHEFNIVFKNQDDSVITTLSIPYNTYLYEPDIIPHLDESALPLTSCYSFVGYSKNKDSNPKDVIDITKLKSNGDMTFYAIFEEGSVYDNVHPEYFIFSPAAYSEEYEEIYGGDTAYNIYDPDGATVAYSVIINKILTGKVTIPATYNGKPVIEVLSNAGVDYRNITHIFFEKGTQVRRIGSNAFNGCNNLKYFEFTDTLREIQQRAFFNCSLDVNLVDLNKNIYKVQYQSFNNAFSGTTDTLLIGGSIVRFASQCFLNLNKATIQNIQVGTSDRPSQINLSGFDDNGSKYIFGANSMNPINSVVFYTNRYSKDELIPYINKSNIGNIEVVS